MFAPTPSQTWPNSVRPLFGPTLSTSRAFPPNSAEDGPKLAEPRLVPKSACVSTNVHRILSNFTKAMSRVRPTSGRARQIWTRSFTTSPNSKLRSRMVIGKCPRASRPHSLSLSLVIRGLRERSIGQVANGPAPPQSGRHEWARREKGGGVATPIANRSAPPGPKTPSSQRRMWIERDRLPQLRLTTAATSGHSDGGPSA